MPALRQAKGGAGAQGTQGGRPIAMGSAPGTAFSTPLGDVGYLWVLIGVEVAVIGYLRRAFRRYHGG